LFIFCLFFCSSQEPLLRNTVRDMLRVADQNLISTKSRAPIYYVRDMTGPILPFER
jgi:hypothetical protein